MCRGVVVVMGVCVKKMKVCPLVYLLKVILLLPMRQIFLKTESFHVLSLDPESWDHGAWDRNSHLVIHSCNLGVVSWQANEWLGHISCTGNIHVNRKNGCLVTARMEIVRLFTL